MSLSRSARTVLAAATVAAVALPLATTAAHAQGSGAPTAAAYAGLPSGTKQAKTLVIGIDGATFDTFSRADVPNLRRLMAKGLTARSNLYASPMAPTVSGAGWSSIATGVWPDKHNVKDNNFTNPNYGRYPDYATRLETADPAVSTLVVGTWSPVPQKIFGAKTDLRIAGGDDEGTTAKAADYLANGNPDSTFVHLDEVDGAGHSTGSASPAYIEALHTADTQVGRLLDAVASRPTYADEDWLVVVTADHGHTPTGGHGGNTPQERGTFVIAQGKGIRPGSVRDDVKITDIAPTVLRHEGVATDPAWNLDGAALDGPEYRLNGAEKATVSYATNYRVDGPQTGDVYVSYDGAAPQLVKSYRSDVNTVERLEFTVPSGTRTARLSFRYTGTNSAFWTVDQVSFAQPAPPSQLAVASLRADTNLLGRPGSDSPWKVTAHAVVRTAQGEPVKGARVTAELTADGTVRELTGTAKKDGSVTFKVTVPRGVAEAALTVTDVRYRDLAYHGELDPVRTLDLDRPTGHRG